MARLAAHADAAHALLNTTKFLKQLHAITRLLWFGFALYTAGLVSGFFTGEPLPRVKMICAIGVWIFYGTILQVRHLGHLAPKRIATLCILAFTAAVSVLWAINFVSQRTS